MDLSTRLRQSGQGRPDSAPKPRATPRRVSAAPPSAPPFELLESKLLPPQGPGGTVSRGELISSLEGSARASDRCPVRRPRLGEDDAARSVGLAVAATVRVGVRRREGQRSDRPADLCRRRARPRLAARSERVRRAGVTGRLGRGDGRPAPGSGPGDDGRGRSSWSWTTCICSTTRPASTPSTALDATRPGGVAAGPLGARPAGAPAGSAAGAGPGAGDRAGRSPHGRGRGAPSC